MPCDLVTGEERIFVDPGGRPSGHIASTIEMCSVTTPCEYREHDRLNQYAMPEFVLSADSNLKQCNENAQLKRTMIN